MSSITLDQAQLENLIKSVLAEKLSSGKDFIAQKDASGVISIKLPTVRVNETNRLNTGNTAHRVYTKDILSLEESPRLGAGIMEMYDTTFDWHLDYDEIDYIIEGALSIITNGRTTTARQGECIFIPKGSDIQFSVSGFARFLYVTYPADWQK